MHHRQADQTNPSGVLRSLTFLKGRPTHLPYLLYSPIDRPGLIGVRLHLGQVRNRCRNRRSAAPRRVTNRQSIAFRPLLQLGAARTADARLSRDLHAMRNKAVADRPANQCAHHLIVEGMPHDWRECPQQWQGVQLLPRSSKVEANRSCGRTHKLTDSHGQERHAMELERRARGCSSEAPG